ncbi:PREDICTED: pilosulin-3a-like [Wasmannia auropunctata]|uniref:pilosulin-3a-like n=1 Tax=Wasmannia auropunctata TaxID=64793 RepID=UPI0005EEE37D|nr:PREDICTED: pilosulin-3a-like [Wasmannia auropunctata]
MRLSYLLLAFAIILVITIMGAPEVKAKPISEADAISEADPLRWGSALKKILKYLKILGKISWKVLPKVAGVAASSLIIGR